MTSVLWELRRVNGNILEANLVDVRIVDAFNRFARDATAIIDDSDGTKNALYPELTPVLFRSKLDTDVGFTDRWGGFVTNPRQEGNQLVIDCLSHDAWLRRRQVFATFTNQSKSSILQSLVTTLTPLTYDPLQVTVVNDSPITRTWRGEPLDVVIQELSDLSSGEEFGADDSATFFFRQANVEAAPSDFADHAYAQTDFDKDATREINRVTLYYGVAPGTGAVTVNDFDRQTELQTKLGSPRPVVSEFTTTYPEITTEAAAIAKAQSLLGQTATIQKGRIWAWDLLQHRPGQVMHVVDSEKSVDADFRIARIEYQWQGDETIVSVAENRMGAVDVLVALSGEVTRIDNRDADATAVILSLIELQAANLAVTTHLQLVTQSVPSDMFLLGEVASTHVLGDGRGKLGDRLGPEVIVYGFD